MRSLVLLGYAIMTRSYKICITPIFLERVVDLPVAVSVKLKTHTIRDVSLSYTCN